MALESGRLPVFAAVLGLAGKLPISVCTKGYNYHAEVNHTPESYVYSMRILYTLFHAKRVENGAKTLISYFCQIHWPSTKVEERYITVLCYSPLRELRPL